MPLVRLYPAYSQERTKAVEEKPSALEKAKECLYRYTSNGSNYARFESKGKEIRRSLAATNRTLRAKRKLGDLQRDTARIDLTAGKSSLVELCEFIGRAGLGPAQ